jgi:hypothetical protein
MPFRASSWAGSSPFGFGSSAGRSFRRAQRPGFLQVECIRARDSRTCGEGRIFIGEPFADCVEYSADLR